MSDSFIDAAEQQYFIGQRIMAEVGVYGTIAYIGPVPGSSGVWLGIDWDNPQRGRHDGVYNGTRYFTAHEITSGSFVRPSKISTGISLLAALDARYCQGLQQLEESKQLGLIVASSSSGCAAVAPSDLNTNNSASDGFRIELIGFHEITEKAADLGHLHDVLLHNIQLATCSEEEAREARRLLSSSVSMNVASTLLSDWSTVARICSAVNHLMNVTVSNNLIRLPKVRSADSSLLSAEEQLQFYWAREDEVEYLRTAAFISVLHLVAVRMRYTWEHFQAVLPWFPNVKILTLAHNKITSMPNLLQSLPQSLTSLDLIGNQLESASVCQDIMNNLSQFPHLKSLMLHECNLEDFTLPEGQPFPRLEQLGLMGNRLQSWNTLNQLNRLPRLHEVSLTNNPLNKSFGDEATARQGIIARLGLLQLLNRATVTKEDRRGAELDYLKMYGQDWLNLQKNDNPTARDDFRTAHPRYEILVELYGAPEQSELKQLTRSLKDSLLEIRIECSDRPGMKAVQLKIPSRMTVQHLLALVRRHLSLPGRQPIRLTYSSNCNPSVEYDIEAGTREVGFYNLATGDVIHVHLT